MSAIVSNISQLTITSSDLSPSVLVSTVPTTSNHKHSPHADMNNNNNTMPTSTTGMGTCKTKAECDYFSFSTYNRHELASERETRDLFYKHYELGGEIGKGGFGTIFSAVRRKDQRPVAVKVIKKCRVTQWYTEATDNDNNCQEPTDTVDSSKSSSTTPSSSHLPRRRIPLEIALMIRVRDIGTCIRILDYMEQRHCFIIVMERLEASSDLFDLITEQGHAGLAESIAKSYFAQIVRTVIAIADLGVLHRDIKDENILVNTTTGQCKLIDFGAGTFTPQNSPLSPLYDFHGTRVYAPPEWLLTQRYYGDRAAVWSLGVLLFNMIYGDVPWEEDTDIIHCRLYSKNGDTFGKLDQQVADSTDVDDLIRLCLIIDDSKRIHIDDILKHKWLQTSDNDC